MHLYRAGMPLALLAEFLGHEDPETTLIYAFADMEMKREAIEKAKGNTVALPNYEEKGFCPAVQRLLKNNIDLVFYKHQPSE